VTQTATDSELSLAAESRPYTVVDLHHHVTRTRGESRAGFLRREVQERLAIMDRFGIDHACLMPSSVGVNRPARVANREVLAVQKRAPDRFPAAFGTIDLEKQSELRPQLRGLVEVHGFQGVVWHHRFLGMYIDDPRSLAAIEACGELGLVAFVHVVGESSYEATWRLARLLEVAPEVKLVALSGFSSMDHAECLISLAGRYLNLHADTGAMNATLGWALERFVGAAGAQRLLLGTDLYMKPKPYGCPFPLLEVLHRDLPTETKAAILGGNAHELLGLWSREV
jgi:predicted TIM-barrel fold metal-dependent hydrolase